MTEKYITPEEIIERFITRAYRDRKRGGPPKPRILDRSREKEYKRRGKIRRDRVRKKLCTACPVGSLQQVTDGFRMCELCRIKWRGYNSKCAARKELSLTPYRVRIDREGPSIDF